MKKLVFTFLTMVVFAFVANTTFAQSVYNNANVGATHEYIVDGLDGTDSWTFIVTLSTEDPYNGGTVTPADGTEFDFVNSETGSGATSASVQITWNTIGNYRVWIQVQDDAGCYNYRFIDVPVTDNNFNVEIIALGSGDENDSDISGFTEATTACPKFVGEEFDDEENDTEGNTYVYYKVTRTLDNASTSDWAFTPAISGSATVTLWESSVDGQNWSTVSTITDELVVTDASGTEDNVWFRATATNVTETQTDLTFNFGTSAYEVTGGIADQDDSGSNTATMTLSPLPQIGDFSGN